MPELDGPAPPGSLLYLWGWFIEIASARTGTGFGGINPIPWSELDAWARLRGITPTYFEIGVLRRLDQALLSAHTEHGRHRGSHQHRNHSAR